MQASKPGSPGNSRLRVSVIVPVLAVFVGLSVLAVMMSHAFRPSFRNESHPVVPASAPAADVSDSASANPRPLVREQNPALISAPAAPSAVHSAPAANAFASQNTTLEAPPARKQVSAEQEISELNDVMNGNRPKSEKLGVALTTLENPNNKVRAAALDAVRDLDDPDAVPRLQELAAQAEDADDKAALLETADFLNLPSFTDSTAANPGAGQNGTARPRHVPPNGKAMPWQARPVNQP